uniref:Plug domain-containing protein n=1 Tax=Ningiella ruwaisensis TaxID=2364274 RepID=UPI00109F0A0D|nr:Plug domain-containing protein [Ningiella ruwaisensis]
MSHSVIQQGSIKTPQRRVFKHSAIALSFSLLFCSSGAYANLMSDSQTQPDEEARNSEPLKRSTQAQQNPENASLEVIEVNALRRTSSLQEVPVSVSAFREDLLNNVGIRDIRDLENLSPSIDVSTGQSAATATAISIRGIGTGSE